MELSFEELEKIVNDIANLIKIIPLDAMVDLIKIHKGKQLRYLANKVKEEPELYNILWEKLPEEISISYI